MHMYFFALSALATGVVALTFGGLVALKDSQKLENRLFFLMSLSVAVWGTSYWYWLSQASTSGEAFFAVILLTAGSLFASLFFSHWVLLTTKASGKFWEIILGSSYGIVLGFIAILLFQTDLLIGPLSEKAIFHLWPDAGPLYLFSIIAAYGFPISMAVGRILVQLVTTTDKAKSGQLLSMLAGTILGFGGTSLNFFLWFDIQVLPYGNFAAILFAPLLGYSIVRHKLFTLRTVATELLVLFTVTGVFVQIFLASSLVNLVLQIVFFLAVTFSSYLLLKSVYSGVKTQEKLEKLSKKLQSANSRLRELDQQKSEFLSIATHQLRGPLAGIRGHLSLIIDGSYGKMPEEVLGVITKIFASSGLLAQTINDFLNVSRIEQGSMQYEMKIFECHTLIADVVEDLTPLAVRAKLELTFVNKSSNSCMINADYAKLRHIFFNLIDNAIKYTEEGWIKVALSDNPKDGTMRIEVSDSGIGISTDEIDNLFQKFVRAQGASKVNVNGTGLGLYVARQMVEAHSGKIWVESEGKGKGSTFVIELPMMKKTGK